MNSCMNTMTCEFQPLTVNMKKITFTEYMVVYIKLLYVGVTTITNHSFLSTY